jgi:hypothetical protein
MNLVSLMNTFLICCRIRINSYHEIIAQFAADDGDTMEVLA